MQFAFIGTILALAGGLGLIWAVLVGHVSLAAALDVAMLLLSLVWLFLLVKIPWDLYFGARKARLDGEESGRRGIRLDPERLSELERLEPRLLAAALAAHAGTALAVLLIGYLSPGTIRPGFAWLFLASAAFRPAWEYHRHLIGRLQELAARMRYPREDVQELRDRVKAAESRSKELEGRIERLERDLGIRISQVEEQVRQVQSRHVDDTAHLERRIVDLSHRFEEAVQQVSSDRELLAGIRAFARMFREQPAS